MTSIRRTAIVAGVFFLITEVTAIAGVLLYGPVSARRTSSCQRRWTTTAYGPEFLEALLAIAVVGTAVTLYPIIKRQNEGMALGHVAGRLIEATIIAVGAISLLAVVTMRQTSPERPVRRPRPPSPSASHWWRSTTGPSSSGRSWHSASTPCCWRT